MIELTKLNGEPIVVNVDVIETLETTPDTVITLTCGKKMLVKETAATIIDKAVEFKRKIYISGYGISKSESVKEKKKRVYR